MKRTMILAALLMALASGCTRVVSASGDSIAIDTTWVADWLPRSQSHVSWPIAERHCRKYGKRATLTDIRSGVAAYACVAPKEGGEKPPETGR